MDVSYVSVRIFKSVHIRVFEPHSSVNRLSTYLCSDDPAAAYIAAKFTKQSALSEATLEQARKWLSSCHSSQGPHRSCPRWQKPFVPTRLIEILEIDRIRLHISDPGEQLRWAALSYYWGGGQPLTSTKSGLISLMQTIPFGSTSKSLQDAVLVTYKLGIRYLWVDSMCIIQDDVDDVAREISHMPKIYQKAAVTISAARVASSSQGFLQDYPTPSVLDHSFRLRYRCPNGLIGSVVLTEDQPSVQSRGQRREPIEERAWTLQESFLSPRMLVFGSQGVYWSCRTIHQDRTFGFPHAYESTATSTNRLRFRNVTVAQGASSARNLPGNTWLSMVEQYTSRKLTYTKDKLPAIAGLAEYCAKHMNDEYLAGHFRSSFLSSLLWRRDVTHAPLISRSKTYRAPSWAWPAAEGEVLWEQWRSPTLKALQLLSYKVELMDSRIPYGSIKAASIQIRGKMREAIWSTDRHWVLDPRLPGESKVVAEAIPDVIEEQSSIWCLEICELDDTRRNWTGMIPHFALPRGLILVTKDGSVFERRGLFRISSRTTNLQSWNSTRTLMDENERLLVRKFWFQGCTSRTITII